jgi:hypothetical protein
LLNVFLLGFTIPFISFFFENIMNIFLVQTEKEVMPFMRPKFKTIFDFPFIREHVRGFRTVIGVNFDSRLLNDNYFVIILLLLLLYTKRNEARFRSCQRNSRGLQRSHLGFKLIKNIFEWLPKNYMNATNLPALTFSSHRA